LKSILFKSCLTGLVLSATGIAGAEETVNLADYSAVSGAAMNIAADSIVANKIAAGAALTFGSSAKMGNTDARPDIYAGAAVTIGSSATIGNVIVGAGASIGANAIAKNVTAGAAVILGADATSVVITAGAAITYGAGTSPNSASQGMMGEVPEVDHESVHMTSLKGEVDAVVADAMETLDNCIQYGTAEVYDGATCVPIGTNITGNTYGPGTYYGSATGTPANGVVTLSGDENAKFNFILSGALSLGAVSEIKLEGGAVAENVTWTTGGSINIGADSKFVGIATSAGSINASTSDVLCGAVYAAGAVSVKSVGQGCPEPAVPVCPYWTVAELAAMGPANLRHTRLTDDVAVLSDNVNDLEAGEFYSVYIRAYEKPVPAGVHLLLATRWNAPGYASEGVLAKDDITELAHAACDATLRAELVSRGIEWR
jgi:hypothetical protein